MQISTTEITSTELASDNPIHQRLILAYEEASKLIEGSILEIGCGVGRGLTYLLGNCEKYTALDKNKKVIEQLQKENPELHFIHQNIPPVDTVPDSSFDFIVSFQVIEHVVKDELFVEEIHRILKPGGKAILTTPNRKKSLTRNPWHVREYTAKEFENLLSKYFDKDKIIAKGVKGNERVLNYYEENERSVKKITRFDIFNLQYLLPRQILQIPYEFLNRMNRNNLKKQLNGLVAGITSKDYYISDDPDSSLDLFYIVEK